MRKRGLVWTVLMLLGVLVATAQATTPTTPAPPAPAPPPAAAPTQPPVALPPDLVALEQKMAQLQVKSERFRAALNFKGDFSSEAKNTIKSKRLPSALGPLRGGLDAEAATTTLALFVAAGDASFAPQRAAFTIKVFGIKVAARLIGSTLFSREPFVARIDGGRPWVRSPNQKLGTAIDDDSVGVDGSGSGPFAKVIKTINEANSLQEVGEQMVDGQVTTEFTGTLSFDAASGASSQELKAFQKLGLDTAKFQIFIAPSGLPVSMRFGFEAKEAEIEFAADVVAINVPVVVHAPPVRQTIGEAQLKLLTERLARKQERALFKRDCTKPRKSTRKLCKLLRKELGKAQ